MVHKNIVIGFIIVAALAVGFVIRGYYEGHEVTPETQDEHTNHDQHTESDACAYEGNGYEEQGEEICPAHGVPEAECEECLTYPRTLEALEGRQCEHEISIIDCDECRYEVGVVKIDPSLIKSPDNDHGLFKIATAQAKSTTQFIDTVGEITLNQNKVARIRPRVEGIISKVKIDLGQTVKAGETLLELDSIELRKSQLNYLKAKALFELEIRQFEREKSMYEKKISTEEELLDAQAEYEKTKIELEIGRKKLGVLGMNEAEIVQLSDQSQKKSFIPLPVKSPLAGVVLKKNVTQGELVNPDMELVVIADLSTLWLWVDIYAQEFEPVRKAKQENEIKVEISVEAYPGKIFTGQLDYISDTVSQETRTIKARISINNSDKLLKPGMFAKCKLFILDNRGSLLIPKESLLKDGRSSFVFKQLKDNLFVKQGVKPGIEYLDHIEVLLGLDEDDRIIAEGGFALKSDILREKMGAG